MSLDVTDPQPCGLCNQLVGRDCIGCDNCTTWFHPKPQCLGLALDSIAAIQRDGGNGCVYKCSKCRCQGARGKIAAADLSPALGQLYEIVKATAVNVAQLTSDFQNLISKQATAPPGAGGISEQDLYTHMHEFNERKKRANSLIVRGLTATNDAELVAQVNAVVRHLVPDSPVPKDGCCIDSAKKIYRITMPSRESKSRLLDSAPNLRNSEFAQVYITRDLTWQQRQAQIKKRAEARSRRRSEMSDGNSQQSSQVSGANSVPISPIPPQPPSQSAGQGRGVIFQ